MWAGSRLCCPWLVGILNSVSVRTGVNEPCGNAREALAGALNGVQKVEDFIIIHCL